MLHIVGCESTELEFLVFLGLVNAGYASVQARRLQGDAPGWQTAENFDSWGAALPSPPQGETAHVVLLGETESVAGALWRLQWELLRQDRVRDSIDWSGDFSWPGLGRMGLEPSFPVLLGSKAAAWKLRAPPADGGIFVVGGDHTEGLFLGEQGAPLDFDVWPEVEDVEMLHFESISAISAPGQGGSEGPSQVPGMQGEDLSLILSASIILSATNFQDSGHLLLYVEDAQRLRRAMRILAIFLFCRGDGGQRTFVTVICPEALHHGQVVSQLMSLRGQQQGLFESLPLRFVPLDLDLVSGWPLERLSSMDFFLFKDRPVDEMWVDASSPRPLLEWLFLRSEWHTRRSLRLVHHMGDSLEGSGAHGWTEQASLFVAADEETEMANLWLGWGNTRVWNLSLDLHRAIAASARALGDTGQMVMVAEDVQRLQWVMHDLSIILCFRERNRQNTSATIICPAALDHDEIIRELCAIRRCICDMLNVPRRTDGFDLRIATGLPLEQLDSSNLTLPEDKTVDLLWVDAPSPEPALRLLLERMRVDTLDGLRLVHHQGDGGVSTNVVAMERMQSVATATEEKDVTGLWAGMRSTTVLKITGNNWVDSVFASDPGDPDSAKK